jgi:hypothetical protein
MGMKWHAYRVEVPEGRRRLGGPRHRWNNNIRMVLVEIRWGGIDWIHLAEDRDQWQAPVFGFYKMLGYS